MESVKYMKTQLTVLALSAILVVSMSMAPVHGQLMQGDPISAPIAISTDAETYESGDTIMVSGSVARGGDGAVTIQIIGPGDSTNRVALEQTMPNVDGTFEVEFTAGGPLMSRDGTYTIIAQYGSGRSIDTTTTFDFVAVMMTEKPDKPDDSNKPSSNIGERFISVEDTDDRIEYDISGARIISLEPNVDSSSLVITIETTDDGVLTMTIPRTILDAKTQDGEMDDDLFVLVDGEEVTFDEERTDADRTVTIEFMHGAETIEIIGTWVIPEFGVIAVMILAVAIISVIAISSKSRISMVPRF